MSGQDIARAVGMAIASGGLDHDARSRVIFGAPWSKSRPKFSRRGGRAYTPQADVDAEARTRQLLQALFPEGPLTGNVSLACLFYRPNRQRIDVDNMLKHICDAATGVVWDDDSQCTGLVGVCELDPVTPRTVVAILPHASSMTRGTDATVPCPQCGAAISLVGRTKPRKYCSTECRKRARGTWIGDPVPCPNCGEPFRRKTTEQRYCTAVCARAAVKGRPRPARQKVTRCASCGKRLTHTRGGRCRECWRDDPRGEKHLVQAELPISVPTAAMSIADRIQIRSQDDAMWDLPPGSQVDTVNVQEALL
jgi:Holliday junction resolvase RusA-like endonuclease